MALQLAAHSETRLIESVRSLALQGYRPPTRQAFSSDPARAALVRTGSELWLDTGDLALAKSMWSAETRGLTTNNTLANQVVQRGTMDDTIKRSAQLLRIQFPKMEFQQLVHEVGFIVNSQIALRLVEAFGVRVSVELHPAVANDVEATCLFARRYYSVCPEYFYIKIPLTPAGYLAVRRLSKEGVPVNFTLGFSARQNYIAVTFSRPAFVNVFLGRLNSVVEENALGEGKYVGEKAAMASQVTVDEVEKDNPEIKTKQIAASLRSGRQILDLAGMDVLTAPVKAVQEFDDMHLKPEAITSHRGHNFKVALGSGKSTRDAGLDVLWDVPDSFRKSVSRLLQEEVERTDGTGLVALLRKCGIEDLFYPFTPSELEAIAKKGKIPELARWKGKVALDDLMTVSALQSFATDQRALDERIGGLIKQAR